MSSGGKDFFYKRSDWLFHRRALKLGIHAIKQRSTFLSGSPKSAHEDKEDISDFKTTISRGCCR